MGALYGMNRRSELIVLRASGLSAWRFLRPAILVVFLMGVLWTVLFNPLAGQAMQKYEELKNDFSGAEQVTEGEEIWLREGTEFEQTVIYAADFNLVERTLFDAEFSVFENQAFEFRLDAKQAVLLPGGYWQLTEVTESQKDGTREVINSMSFPTTITPRQMQDSQSQNGISPVWELPAEITALSQAGFSSTQLQIQYHKLLSLPLTLIAMAIIAAGVSMRLTREGGTLQFMLTGAAIGFAVFFIENMIRAFGEAGSISPLSAGWIIPVFVLACGLTYLSRVEDG